VFEWSDMSTRR